MRNRLLSILCVLVLLMSCLTLAGAEEIEKPEIAKPTQNELEKLRMVIEGPDERMPMEISYKDFVEGKFELDDLEIGKYTVRELNAGTLLENYEFVAAESVALATFEVKLDETTTVTLVNVYEYTEETETNDQPPEEEDTEYVTVPVTKTWVDDENRDGNRPASVTINLLANGQKTTSAFLTAQGGWSYEFTGLPKLDESGAEIVYTVTEDAVPLYTSQVNGYSIVNTYVRETTSASVKKIWVDEDNLSGLRPTSLYATLSNGQTVVLNEANNWSATVTGLPVMVNGKKAVYTWREQEALGYEQTSVTTEGGVTTFTNTLRKRPTPPPGKNTPPVHGDPYLIIEDSQTPLGVDVIINHVGDCFD